MRMLRPTFALISVVIFNSGCASTASISVKQERLQTITAYANTDQQRADRYLDTLRAKKNRFLSENGYDTDYVPGVSPNENVNQVANVALGLSECDKISYGNWSASVMYGQTFAAYENYVRTMERCYQASGKS